MYVVGCTHIQQQQAEVGLTSVKKKKEVLHIRHGFVALGILDHTTIESFPLLHLPAHTNVMTPLAG